MNISPENLFAALSNSTRLRCVLLLMQYDELCVCELNNAIGVAQPHLSRHLAQLRESKLVTDRRQGLWIYYRINPSLPDWIRSVLRETVKGIEYQSPFKDDLATLAKMPKLSGASRCA